MMPIVDYNPDDATYVGDEEDGCYYQVQQNEADHYWYVTIVVDCNSAGWIDDLETDSGPFTSEDAAKAHGHSVAVEWCINNGVQIDGEDMY